jgi:photosystem II stability/assembly factor-like uncharacterized protein
MRSHESVASPRSLISTARMIVMLGLTSLVGIPAQAGANRWTIIGPPADMRTMAVDPYDPAILHAAGRDVVARSNDRGATWTLRQLPGLGRASFIRVAPSLPSTLYLLGAQKLYRSTNGGDSWTPLAAPRIAQFQNDLQVDATNSKVLVVAASNFCFLGCSGGGVFRSTNGGDSWQAIGLTNTNVWRAAIDPAESQIIYATTETQLLRTGNRGGSWRDWTPPGSGSVRGVAVDPILPETIYAATGAGVFRSRDAGQSWELARASSGSEVATPVFRSPRLLVSSAGLALSIDQGQTWRELTTAGSGLDFRSLEQIVISRDVYYMVADLAGAPGQILAYEIRQPRRRAVGR